MRIEVDTAAVVGVADAVRRAAAQVGSVELPRAAEMEDVAARDSVDALLAVSGEALNECARALRWLGMLIEVAAIDYARVEGRASVSR